MQLKGDAANVVSNEVEMRVRGASTLPNRIVYAQQSAAAERSRVAHYLETGTIMTYIEGSILCELRILQR